VCNFKNTNYSTRITKRELHELYEFHELHELRYTGYTDYTNYPNFTKISMATVGINKEESSCPRCGRLFYCHAVDIVHCACYAFRLDEAASRFIKETYSNCLCLACLQELQQQHLPGEAAK
jgi:hypothetical protein